MFVKVFLFLTSSVPSKRHLQDNLAVSSRDSALGSPSSSTVICTVNKISEMRARANRLRSDRSRRFSPRESERVPGKFLGHQACVRPRVLINGPSAESLELNEGAKFNRAPR